MDPSPIRILHLTDLHMRQALDGTADRSERLSRDIPALLDELKGRLADWRPDVIVMTGDLLDVPDEVVDGRGAEDDPAAYAGAVTDAEADYRWMHDWLRDTDLPFAVIPGNHDHRGSFTAVFGTASPDVVHHGVRFVGFDDQLDGRRTPYRPEDEHARFESALADARDGRPQIHLQHYLLRPRVHRRTAYSYERTPDLVGGVERSPNVKAVLSGHFHPGAYARGLDGTVYSTAPAFCETPFPFRLMNFDANGAVRVEDCALQ